QVLHGSVFAVNTAALASLSGNGTNLLTMSGTIAALNAALDGLEYQAPAGTTSDYLNVLISARGQSGVLGTVIAVDSTPDISPVVSAPAQQAANAAGAVFATANGNAIHLSDGDANGSPEAVH